jgi:hypothetical protein
MLYDHIALKVPQVFIPSNDVDFNSWAVVACDQHTSDKGYWDKVRKIVKDTPSSLDIIFPEVFLGKYDLNVVIEKIEKKMNDYLNQKILVPIKKGFVLVDRQTPYVDSRKGLIVALDLDAYNYRPGSHSLIRATEGTIEERLPPRIHIRQNSLLELPHILVLLDDPSRSIIEPLFKYDNKKLYNFKLMQNGGSIRGYLIDKQLLQNEIAENINKLLLKQLAESEQSEKKNSPLLYAVGDGNHSLAAAKAHWSKLKKNLSHNDLINHPAQFALVELINLHDNGLAFEPIHRLLTGISVNDICLAWKIFCEQSGRPHVCFSTVKNKDILLNQFKNDEGLFVFLCNREKYGFFDFSAFDSIVAIKLFQEFIDELINDNSNRSVDYIHGTENLISLGCQEDAVGFLFPSIKKEDLFPYIRKYGVLPRKSFSIGEAEEKRYYFETRKIK